MKVSDMIPINVTIERCTGQTTLSNQGETCYYHCSWCGGEVALSYAFSHLTPSPDNPHLPEPWDKLFAELEQALRSENNNWVYIEKFSCSGCGAPVLVAFDFEESTHMGCYDFYLLS